MTITPSKADSTAPLRRKRLRITVQDSLAQDVSF